MNLERLTNHPFMLRKRSGVEVAFNGLLSANQLTTFDATLPVEEGDTIKRTLPNGTAEHYLVVDTGFHDRFRTIAAHFQTRLRKETPLNAY